MLSFNIYYSFVFYYRVLPCCACYCLPKAFHPWEFFFAAACCGNYFYILTPNGFDFSIFIRTEGTHTCTEGGSTHVHNWISMHMSGYLCESVSECVCVSVCNRGTSQVSLRYFFDEKSRRINLRHNCHLIGTHMCQQFTIERENELEREKEISKNILVKLK